MAWSPRRTKSATSWFGSRRGRDAKERRWRSCKGHLDMVCEKNEGTVHNFDVDPIKVIRDGDWLKADGTTLGSDNGVGVAAALAVMESRTLRMVRWSSSSPLTRRLD